MVPKLEILIVDDKPENRYLLEAMLGAQGFGTVSAANGIEALEHVKNQHFDAIISDLLMPKMDGFQLLRTCKKDPKLSSIPFIIYTATYTDTKDVEFGLSLGAARYIIKPAEPDDLLRELNGTLGRVAEGTLVDAEPASVTNEMVDQEYVRRLVAKLDKKILDLEKSEEKYRTVFENTGTAMVVLEQDNTISLANAEFANLSGFSKNDIENKKSWTEFVVEEDLERMLAQHRLRRQNRENALTHYEFRFITKSGDIRDISLTIDLIPGTTKSVASLLDITAARSAIEALRKSEEKFRSVFDWTNDAILLHTLTTTKMPGRFIEVNKGACLMLRYTRDELLRLGPSDIVPVDQHPLLGEIIRQAAVKESVLFETRFLRKDGSTFPVESSAHLVTYGGQNIWISHVRDITRRKQAEEAIRESEAKYRLLAETSPEMIYLVDIDGNLQYLNDTAARQFHTAPGRLVGKHLSAIFPPHVAQNHLEALRKVAAERRVLCRELVEEFPSGTVYIEFRLTSVIDSNGQVTSVLGLSNDITQRRQAEEALRLANAYNRSLIEASLDPLVTISHDGKIQDVNSATELATGMTRNELIGTDFSTYFTEPEKARQGYLNVFLWGYVFDYPLEIRHRDGHTVPVLYNATVYRDPDGNVQGVFAAARDITERRKAEEQREILISELAQKNAELDRFTYTVSHDLKSPLVGIRAFLSLLEDDLRAGDAAQVETDIRRIGESSEKLEHLITTLLTLSRSGRTVDIPVTIPFTELAREAAEMLASSFKERGVTLVIPDNLPEISGDRQRLLQVMTNLLDNAIRFMGDQQEPVIEVGVRNETGVPLFFVRDNGMGIDPANQPELFGLFERFNPDIPGTGIGLATVKRIIEAHGGTIRAESEGKGEGTTFLFTLPSGDGSLKKCG